MPGPPPKPAAQRRRRNTTTVALYLPPDGRRGDPPPWPLPGDPSDAEAGLWEELWATPQAAAWVLLGSAAARVVARYCRWLAAAEAFAPGDVSASVLGELRQLEDRLGLTPMAMRRLGWEIAGAGDQAAAPAAATRHATSARRPRVRLTDG